MNTKEKITCSKINWFSSDDTVPHGVVTQGAGGRKVEVERGGRNTALYHKRRMKCIN